MSRMVCEMNIPTLENSRHRQQIVESGHAYQRVDELAGSRHIAEDQGNRVHTEKTHPSPAYRAYYQQGIGQYVDRFPTQIRHLSSFQNTTCTILVLIIIHTPDILDVFALAFNQGKTRDDLAKVLPASDGIITINAIALKALNPKTSGISSTRSLDEPFRLFLNICFFVLECRNELTNIKIEGRRMAPEEQVLVVERKVIEQIGMFQGLAFDAQRYLDEIFIPGVPRFMPRSQVEGDPSFKQLIPYVLMAHDSKYLSYVRGKRAGESRLVALRSIGIGGHINPVDADNSTLFAHERANYESAVQREVQEEVDVKADHKDRIVALLNDESNEVGSVHLGIVHFWNLDSPEVSKREQMITQMEFMSADELEKVRDSLETWSALCLDRIDEMAEGD